MKTVTAPDAVPLAQWMKDRIALLADLPEDELLALAKSARCVEFAPQETIIHQGMTIDDLHLIFSGKAAVRVRPAPGKTLERAVLGPGEIFGETSILEHGTAYASVRAEEAVTAYLIGQETLLAVVESNPRFKERLQALILARRAQTEKPAPAAA